MLRILGAGEIPVIFSKVSGGADCSAEILGSDPDLQGSVDWAPPMPPLGPPPPSAPSGGPASGGSGFVGPAAAAAAPLTLAEPHFLYRI